MISVRTGNACGLRARHHCRSDPSRASQAARLLRRGEQCHQRGRVPKKNEFLSLAQPSIKAHGSSYLAAGRASQDCQGQRQNRRVVIIIWSSMEQLEVWYKSPEYQKVLQIGAKYAPFANTPSWPSRSPLKFGCMRPPQLAASFISKGQARNVGYWPLATRRLRMAERRFRRKAEMALSSLPCAASRRLGRSRQCCLFHRPRRQRAGARLLLITIMSSSGTPLRIRVNCHANTKNIRAPALGDAQLLSGTALVSSEIFGRL